MTSPVSRCSLGWSEWSFLHTRLSGVHQGDSPSPLRFHLLEHVRGRCLCLFTSNKNQSIEEIHTHDGWLDGWMDGWTGGQESLSVSVRVTSLLAKGLPVCRVLSGGCSVFSMMENHLFTNTRAGLLGALQCCSPSRLVKVLVFQLSLEAMTTPS